MLAIIQMNVCTWSQEIVTSICLLAPSTCSTTCPWCSEFCHLRHFYVCFPEPLIALYFKYLSFLTQHWLYWWTWLPYFSGIENSKDSRCSGRKIINTCSKTMFRGLMFSRRGRILSISTISNPFSIIYFSRMPCKLPLSIILTFPHKTNGTKAWKHIHQSQERIHSSAIGLLNCSSIS